MHFIETRNVGGGRREKDLQRERSKQETDKAADKAKDDVLSENLPRETTRASTNRRPHGHLTTTSGCARQLQMGDVDTRDEQHADDGSEQQPQRRLCPAGQLYRASV